MTIKVKLSNLFILLLKDVNNDLLNKQCAIFTGAQQRIILGAMKPI